MDAGTGNVWATAASANKASMLGDEELLQMLLRIATTNVQSPDWDILVGDRPFLVGETPTLPCDAPSTWDLIGCLRPVPESYQVPSLGSKDRYSRLESRLERVGKGFLYCTTGILSPLQEILHCFDHQNRTGIGSGNPTESGDR